MKSGKLFGLILTALSICISVSVNALDLSYFPEPFIKNNNISTLIIVGDNAHSADLMAALDISDFLNSQIMPSSLPPWRGALFEVIDGKKAVYERQAYKYKDKAKIYFKSESIDINELIGAKKPTITANDLSMLRGGILSTAKGTTNYNQYIRFNESKGIIVSGKVVFDINQHDQIGDYLKFASGDIMFEYELEFEKGLKSDIKNIDADPAFEVEDMHDEAINILGKTFSIVDTDLEGDSLVIEFISGEILDTLGEGEIKTYTVDGLDYEVEIITITDRFNNNLSSVKLRVNDEITDELKAGEFDVLQDGLEIAVRTLMPNEAGDIYSDIIEFYLGSSKLRFRDDNFTDDEYFSGVEINEENIERALVRITADRNGNEFRLSKIEYYLIAKDIGGDVFIPPGQRLRDYLDEPQGMITENWDILFDGYDKCDATYLEFLPTTDEEYNIRFVNNDNLKFDIPFLDNSNVRGRGFNFGDEDDDLIICESRNISSTIALDPLIDEKDYFITTTGPLRETSITNVLRFDSINIENKEMKFINLATGDKRITFRTKGSDIGGFIFGRGTLPIDGKPYGVIILNETTTGDFIGGSNPIGEARLAIDLDNDGSFTSENGTRIVAKSGIEVFFTGINCTNNTIQDRASEGGNFTVLIIEPTDEVKTDREGDNAINATFESRPENRVGIKPGGANAFVIGRPNESAFSSEGGIFTLKENDDISLSRVNNGALFRIYDAPGSNKAEVVVIEYPEEILHPQIYVVSSTPTSEFGHKWSLDFSKLKTAWINNTKFASDVEDLYGQNIIIVGGPCANEAARKIMGLSLEKCSEEFKSGKAGLRLYDTGSGNYALIVAGQTPVDTYAAANILAYPFDYNLSGTMMEINSEIVLE